METMASTISNLDRKAALLLAALFAVVAVVIAVAALANLPAALANSPILRVPLENLDTPDLGAGNGEVRQAAYAEADVQPATLTGMERGLLIGSALLGGLAGMLSAATLGLLSWSVYRDAGFGKHLAWSVGLSGIVVMVWGLLGPVMDAVAHHSILDRIGLLPERGGSSFFLLELNLWPVAVGLGCAVVAGIFDAGRRQQRDLEGLV